MKNSNIEWTTHTFNPWIGCTKVSDGCKNCYAEALDKRWGHKRWGPNAARVRTSAANWKNPLRWDREAREAGRRDRVFCASLADVFDDHPSIDPQWRTDLTFLIHDTPNLDWLLLTKRPENILRLEPDFAAHGEVLFPNVWLGTTVENQEQAEKRIPELLKVPAKVRFLSCEPLLGPVDLSRWLIEWNLGIDHSGKFPNHTLVPTYDDGRQPMGLDCTGCSFTSAVPIDWVIVGGESGHGARPSDLQWARDIRDQCSSAGVACFVKQLGAKATEIRPSPFGGKWAGGDIELTLTLKDRKGGDWSEWPEDLRVRQFPEVR
jgi:protein gp37